MMASDRDMEIKRLIVTKRLYLHACGHAKGSDKVGRIIAILNLDNVVEMLLKNLAEKYEIELSAKEDPKFKDLWNGLKTKKNDIFLPSKGRIFALHDLRNLIQHRGEIPSSESVVANCALVGEFFQGICTNHFGISYESLHLSELIIDSQLKLKMENSEKKFENGDFSGAFNDAKTILLINIPRRYNMVFQAGYVAGILNPDPIAFIPGKEEEWEDVPGERVWDMKRLDGRIDSGAASEIRRAVISSFVFSTYLGLLGEQLHSILTVAKYVKAERLDEDACKDAAELTIDVACNVILRMQEVCLDMPAAKTKSRFK